MKNKILILIPFICFNVYSKIEVCGEIQYSTDWILKDSPYIVTNDIYIPKQSRIRVEPGVVVQFKKPGPCKELFIQHDWSDSAYSTIKVEGALYLTGTPELPILFENIGGNNNKTGWDGIRITGKSGILIEMFNVKFRGANNAVNVKNSSFRISNCIFENNNVGINLNNGANIRIINNNFIHNRSSGIAIAGSNPFIYNNIFAMNSNYGIWSDSRVNIKIGYSNFWENTEGNCFKCASDILEFNDINENKDSIDKYNNLSLNPIFKDSPAHQKYKAMDLNVPTSISNVKSEKMANREWEAIKKRMAGKTEKSFSYLGKGPYLLSKYSPLKNAGHPDKNYNDRDDTRNDIGYHGGSPSASSFVAGKASKNKK